MNETGVVQRALELAAQGVGGFHEIRKALKKEGFTESTIEQHLGGAGMRKELLARSKASRAHGGEVSQKGSTQAEHAP